jgi:hypothetical protein
VSIHVSGQAPYEHAEVAGRDKLALDKNKSNTLTSFMCRCDVNMLMLLWEVPRTTDLSDFLVRSTPFLIQFLDLVYSLNFFIKFLD